MNEPMNPEMGMMHRPQPPQFNTQPDRQKAAKKQRQVQKLREQAQAEGATGQSLQGYDDILSTFDAHFNKALKEGKAKKLEEKAMTAEEARQRKRMIIGSLRQMINYQMQYEMYNRVADVSNNVENLQSGFENRDVTGGSYADAVEDRYSEIVNDVAQPATKETDAQASEAEESDEKTERDLPYMDTSETDEPSDGYDY